ncbi:protein MLP1 isoform X2 [Orussus abietinus]|uniref:protein MLP1 isoform X2 n=1 Tax=Orussus abietinus TaxID=222816 RepID=UPI00062568F2|nr:protein MLP1 isoform X2 [Orussus abietinus]
MYPSGRNTSGLTDVSVNTKHVEPCKAFDKETGVICKETEGLRILEEFQKLYQSRIEQIDNEATSQADRTSMKLQIMTEWIKDLGEQNLMLVRTVEDLEETACQRVKMLEEKLLQTAGIVGQNIVCSNHSVETLNSLNDRINQLEKDEVNLHRKIEYLQSDIRGLLELIRRGRQENCWSLDGITFFEIRPDDIPPPIDCTCGQEEGDGEGVQRLKEQLIKIQEKERNAVQCQAQLEEKLAELNRNVLTKEETIKQYVSKLQRLRDNLMKRSRLGNCIVSNSNTTGINHDSDIDTIADIVESAIIARNLEDDSLYQQLQAAEAKLIKITHEKDTELSTLRTQLDEKNRKLEEIEYRLAYAQKESQETREALTAEVAEKHDLVMTLRKEVAQLEEQCRQANMQTHFKDDIIKEMRKELKQTTLKETCPSSRRVRINTEPCVERYSSSRSDTSCSSYKDQIVSYLSKTKALMEKEKDTLLDLKAELEYILQEFNVKENQIVEHDLVIVHEKLQDIELLLRNYKTQVIDHPESTECGENYITTAEEKVICLKNILRDAYMKSDKSNDAYRLEDITRKLSSSVQGIFKICTETEKAIALLDCVKQKYNEFVFPESGKTYYVTADQKDSYLLDECSRELKNDINTRCVQQFRIMEEFRICTVEAQAATEDLQEEIATVITTFNVRHERYLELHKMVTEVQDHLAKTRESISDAINRLELQEEQRVKFNDRIINGRARLKDIKNELNQTRCDASRYMYDSRDSAQECSLPNRIDTRTCRDLFDIVGDEVEQVVNTLQVFQSQGCITTSLLAQLKSQLYSVEGDLKDLQRKADEILSDNEAAQQKFCKRAARIERLEAELDCTHVKMQDILENFIASKDIVSDQCEYPNENQCQNQVPRGLPEDEETNEWQYRVVDLQEQVKKLQNEMKCRQDTNTILRQSLETMEIELASALSKVEAHKRSCLDNSELKRKISELESTVKMQKETEDVLRKNLTCSEIELKKSKELLDSFKYNEPNSDGLIFQCRFPLTCQLENVPQPLKGLQDVMELSRTGLQDLGNELKKLKNVVCKDSFCTSSGPVMAASNILEKLAQAVEDCLTETDKLKHVLTSKDKLLQDKDEIIRIQDNSIRITQTELKDLHRKLQEQIDLQTGIVSMYEKDQAFWLKQIEQHTQSIETLQSIVADAKRCLNEIENKAVSDPFKTNEDIRVLSLYLAETENQYKECFAEAASQSTLLELQRSAIDSLQEKIQFMENDNIVTVAFLHLLYYCVLSKIQGQIEERIQDFNHLRSEMYALIQSKNCLKEKYLSMKKMWQEVNSELEDLKCVTSLREFSTKHSQTEVIKNYKDRESNTQDIYRDYYRNSATMTDAEELSRLLLPEEKEIEERSKILAEENESMKMQLKEYRESLEIMENKLDDDSRDGIIKKLQTEIQELASVEASLKTENEKLKIELDQHISRTQDIMWELKASKENENQLEKYITELKTSQMENIDAAIVRDELKKYNSELLKLTTKAETKQEELSILQELKIEFEKIEDLEKSNEALEKDIEILQTEDKDKEVQIMKYTEIVGHLTDDLQIKGEEVQCLQTQIEAIDSEKKEQKEIIEALRIKMKLSEQQAEDYLNELNNSKDLLSIFRDRVHSLKVLLEEKSNDLVKLQVDYQVMKNDNSILESEKAMLENKAKECISDLKKRLKQVQFKLCISEDNYCKVTQDFNRSQELLIQATKREVDVQRALTNLESEFFAKVASAEQEESRLCNLADELSGKLETAHEELAAKSTELCQVQSSFKSCSDQLKTSEQNITLLNEKIASLESEKCKLKQELQEYMNENTARIKENNADKQNDCKYMSELNDTLKSLLELRKESLLKTKSLEDVSTGLTQTAMSGSELCNESQCAISCIRAWMEEQVLLVNTLTTKLKAKQQQLKKIAFEKRALLATLRVLKKANCNLSRRHMRSSVPSNRGTRNNCTSCCASASSIPQDSNVQHGTNSSIRHLHQRYTATPVRVARRTSVRGNSWWFPKLEQLTKELRKNNQWWNENTCNGASSDPCLEENHDYGYQSSTSK